MRLESSQPRPTLVHLTTWLRTTLGDEFPADTNGIWWAGDGRPVVKLGIALEGNQHVAERATETKVDAVLLHRPWGMGQLPQGVGVIACHEALDERLTTGDNPWLAHALGFTLTRKIRTTHIRPLLTLATVKESLTAATLMSRLHLYFPRLECWNPAPPTTGVYTVAFAIAMRPTLLAIAASYGATFYITGTLRPKMQPFLEQSRMTAIGVGHTAGEQWGLVWLARQLHTIFGIELVWLDKTSA